MIPFSFQFPLADFDLTRLPVDPALLRGNASMLASAVQEFYLDSFQKLGGSATVLVRDGVVSVAWQPESGDASVQLLQYTVGLLRQGNVSTAEPILRAILARDSRDPDALYNLGMVQIIWLGASLTKVALPRPSTLYRNYSTLILHTQMGGRPLELPKLG